MNSERFEFQCVEFTKLVSFVDLQSCLPGDMYKSLGTDIICIEIMQSG